MLTAAEGMQDNCQVGTFKGTPPGTATDLLAACSPKMHCISTMTTGKTTLWAMPSCGSETFWMLYISDIIT